MFDLEQAIAEWRRKMTAAGIKTPVPFEELENHLRDEIERQMRAGTESKQAFETGVQKIGPASALKIEFKKVDATRKARARALEQKLAFILANLISLGICSLVFFNPRSQMTSGQRMSCLAATATFTLLIWTGRLGYRLFPVVRSKRTRDVIGVLSGVFIVLWYIVSVYVILPRCEFTQGQLAVAVIWGLNLPSGVFMGLTLGIETAARKKDAIAAS